jgi:hypothetical protein
MASFVQTGDPNAHKITNSSVSAVPSTKSGKQFVVRTGGVAEEGIGGLEKRCAFWLSVGEKVSI